MKEDVRTVFSKDPAARSMLEVILLYPGLHALWAHRIARFLWRHRWLFVARWISETARFFTGIEIHPGATIGRRLFIDHGMGVVIGETAEIGDDVLMYQGVVLGGTALEKAKRHPTIGNNVVIGSAAILLGPITVGDGARVGANSVVVRSVPPGVTVVGVPGRVVEDRKAEAMPLEHGKLPDPFAIVINLLIAEQAAMEQRVKRIEETVGVPASREAEESLRELAEARYIFTEGGGI
ncbi:MAG: serine O-acetyltransferase [Chloroflexi bacterium]|nr:serine O-acetyltransferase [Chloroflexota bacterium]